MCTTWSHPSAVTSPGRRAGRVDGGAPRAQSLDPEFARSAIVSTVDEVVEHPMTPEDVAVLLQIDRETVYRMARRGELPAFKVSSRWRFLPSRLQRWMEEQEAQRR
jgi:excisionase family DNA binding protein